MLRKIEGWYGSLKTRFYDPRKPRTKNFVKLGLVILAWLMTGNDGLSIVPMAVTLFFFYRLAGKWSTWMTLVGIGLLIGFYNSTGFGFRSFNHMALNNALFFTPICIFFLRLIREWRKP